MDIINVNKAYKAIGAAVALSIVAVPVIVQADASNPVYTPKKKKKAMAKPRAKAKPVVRRAPAPAPQPAPEPVVYTPEPAPVYTPPPPPPVYTPPPPPAPVVTAPAAPVATSGGGSGWLLGALAGLAAVGGVILATNGDKATSP